MSTTSISINRNAELLLYQISEKHDILGFTIENHPSGAKLYDFSNANIEGSLFLSRILMSDLSVVQLCPVKARIKAQSGTIDLNLIDISTQHPLLSCMASLYAGWTVKAKKTVDGKKKTYFKAMGSGPARALAQVERDLYAFLDYTDSYSSAVLFLETAQKPDENVITYVSEKCRIEPKDLHILYAPTTSLAGSVQIASRVVETALHKFKELGIDLRWVVSGCGSCPIAPVLKDPMKAMGVTNDCIMFTGKVTLSMDIPTGLESKFISLFKKSPSNASPSYGKPFIKTLQDAGGDFYKIDSGLFAPAQITVINRTTNNIFTEGDLAPEKLDFTE
ncbi:MAG: methenyltetrahydromethanopterin cyclohydrolase [Candidatus Lokiarchaeota archaeon]|nr:methenyltetrahydromethanopterin cyclohydrolase [Candidatus Lokiarchaeota archaeon]